MQGSGLDRTTTMKTHGWLLTLSALVSACSGGVVGDPNSGSNSVEPTGQTQQRAQFAASSLINLVDPGRDPNLFFTASSSPETIEVFYVGAKTTDTGDLPAAVTLAQTISLAADQTVRHDIDMKDPAFAGGYGAILVTSNGQGLFQTYAQYAGSMFSTGGSVFMGTSYRIPYWTGTLRIVLAITNQSDFPCDVQISNVGTTMVKSVTLPGASTYRFDSAGEGWTLSGTNSVQLLTSAGATIALSGYLDRVPHRIRITPVKAAPYL